MTVTVRIANIIPLTIKIPTTMITTTIMMMTILTTTTMKMNLESIARLNAPLTKKNIIIALIVVQIPIHTSKRKMFMEFLNLIIIITISIHLISTILFLEIQMIASLEEEEVCDNC